GYTGRGTRNLHMPDLWVIGVSDFLRCMVGTSDTPFHIGLPRTDPDFPDEHIRYAQCVLAGYHQLKRSARFFGRKRQFPLSVGTGGRLLHLVVEFHFYIFAWVGPPPYHNGLVPLEHHSVCKNLG